MEPQRDNCSHLQLLQFDLIVFLYHGQLLSEVEQAEPLSRTISLGVNSVIGWIYALIFQFKHMNQVKIDLTCLLCAPKLVLASSTLMCAKRRVLIFYTIFKPSINRNDMFLTDLIEVYVIVALLDATTNSC